jgi:hypothetical protein
LIKRSLLFHALRLRKMVLHVKEILSQQIRSSSPPGSVSYVGEKNVSKDGPVFSLAELEKLTKEY